MTDTSEQSIKDPRQFLDDYEKRFRKNRKRPMQWGDIAEMMQSYAEARAEQSTETPPTEIAEKIRARIYLLWQNTKHLKLEAEAPRPVEKETGESK